MASLKRSYTKTTLLDLSAKIMDRLEETDLFQQASCIALYHAIPGEVQTAGLIEKWYRKKRLLLPLIKGMIFNCSCMQEKNHSKRVFSGYWNQAKIVKPYRKAK